MDNEMNITENVKRLMSLQHSSWGIVSSSIMGFGSSETQIPLKDIGSFFYYSSKKSCYATNWGKNSFGDSAFYMYQYNDLLDLEIRTFAILEIAINHLMRIIKLQKHQHALKGMNRSIYGTVSALRECKYPYTEISMIDSGYSIADNDIFSTISKIFNNNIEVINKSDIILNLNDYHKMINIDNIYLGTYFCNELIILAFINEIIKILNVKYEIDENSLMEFTTRINKVNKSGCLDMFPEMEE